jgi:hemerythrin
MTQWTQELETGIPELDAQHRNLLGLIEQLTGLIETPTINEEEVQVLIAFLENYALQHFACEERCMTETHCPTRESNQEAHQAFQKGVLQFKHDFADKEEKRELLTILQASLRAWMRNHILKIDTALRGLPRVKYEC